MSEDKMPPQTVREDFDPAAEVSCDLRPRAEIAFSVAQAKTLRAQAEKGGLAFQAWLPPQQALWILDLIEHSKYGDPGEAVFNLLGEAQDLAPHDDLRKELLKRSLDAALNNPGPVVPIEACVPDMLSRMEGPQPAPAEWQEWPGEGAQPDREDHSG